MKYIRKLWVRIIFSLFAGGIISELIHIKVGDMTPQSSTLLLWIGAGITFGVLSLIIWIDKYRYYFFPQKNDDEDILDEID